MKKENVLVRKIKLIPVGDDAEVDRVLKYIKDGIYSQYRAMNMYISSLYMMSMMEATKDDRKEANTLFSRVSDSSKGSAYPMDIQFPVGLGIASVVGHAVKTDYENAIKKGLLKGKTSLPSYKRDHPLMIHNRWISPMSADKERPNGMYHTYESDAELEERIYTDREVQVFIRFVNNITFRMELGNPKQSTMAIRDEVLNLLKGNYTVGDSSIGKDGKKLTLYLTMKTPVKEVTLDENTIVGVDLGIAVPAVCALNNCDDRYLFIGSKKAHTDFCTKMQKQRSRLQEQVALNRGGHGRKKKCKPLDRFTKREHNYKTTSNHKISRDVVDFAIEHHAKYIHLEDLSGISKERKNKWVLRNWTYAQLQGFIEYKASKVGIIVKYINPHHTSQNCSACREWCEGNREDQAHFKCKICGNEMNADLNAARNIAMSTNYSNKKSATDDVDEDEVA